jgi:hypothetical protein
MRLINVDTQKLEWIDASYTPSYAILSHTWEDYELTFQDLASLRYYFQSRPVKLSGACREAKKSGLKYVWIDSCCINKADHVELSEAINSMFEWYRRAQVCYVYLSDVALTDDESVDLQAFRASRWFTRGWTLQELLAPRELSFYDKDWKYIGTKSKLAEAIQQITGIPTSFLRGSKSLKEASVAQRFSWAAYRETTRIEDQAYSLLGLFGIRMNMLYGERESRPLCGCKSRLCDRESAISPS